MFTFKMFVLGVAWAFTQYHEVIDCDNDVLTTTGNPSSHDYLEDIEGIDEIDFDFFDEIAKPVTNAPTSRKDDPSSDNWELFKEEPMTTFETGETSNIGKEKWNVSARGGMETMPPPLPKPTPTTTLSLVEHRGFKLGTRWTETDKRLLPTYCEECRLNCQTPYLYQLHANREHPKRKAIPCLFDGCDTWFTQISSLHRHQRKKHKSPKSEVNWKGMEKGMDGVPRAVAPSALAEGKATLELLKLLRVDLPWKLTEAKATLGLTPVDVPRMLTDGNATLKLKLPEVESRPLSRTYCAKCRLECDTPWKYKLHGKERHPAKQILFKCGVEGCEKSYNDMSNMYRHQNACHGRRKRFKKRFSVERTWKCGDCGDLFDDRFVLKKHVKEQHYGITLYHCSVCYTGFSKKGDQILHKDVHVGIKGYECRYCCCTFPSLDEMKNHNPDACKEEGKVDVLQTVVDVGLRCYRCDMKYEWNDLRGFSKHLEEHETYVPCPVCGIGFRISRGADRMKRHVIVAHREAAHASTDIDEIFRNACAGAGPPFKRVGNKIILESDEDNGENDVETAI